MKNEFSVFPIDNSPGFIINRLARELNACLYRAFHNSGFDITAQQWAVLNRLWEKEGLHQSALAERTIKNRHNMTRILAHLERKGYVLRKTDQWDRRLIRVYLTRKGKQLQNKLIPIAQDILSAVLGDLSRNDLKTLRRIHAKIIDNLEMLSRK
jgi:DNA-binding MarR family transcriptional regulator